MKYLSVLWVLVVLAITACNDDSDKLDKIPSTYIIPGVVECIGHVERETLKPLPKMLVCDDGRVFHNITNYQELKQLNPLYNGNK